MSQRTRMQRLITRVSLVLKPQGSTECQCLQPTASSTYLGGGFCHLHTLPGTFRLLFRPLVAGVQASLPTPQASFFSVAAAWVNQPWCSGPREKLIHTASPADLPSPGYAPKANAAPSSPRPPLRGHDQMAAQMQEPEMNPGQQEAKLDIGPVLLLVKHFLESNGFKKSAKALANEARKELADLQGLDASGMDLIQMLEEYAFFKHIEERKQKLSEENPLAADLLMLLEMHMGVSAPGNEQGDEESQQGVQQPVLQQGPAMQEPMAAGQSPPQSHSKPFEHPRRRASGRD